MKCRKKPVVLEAIQWNGDNYPEIWEFCKSALLETEEYLDCSKIERLIISTLEGQMIVSVDDFIICGVNGEFYPCKPDIFEKTYEAVNDNEISE
jgi:hypothetical protein